MFALLTDWTDQDVTGWLMSEKLDGWRVMWTGREFVTRGGKVLDAPKSWHRGMPKESLDGELYGGKGSLYEVKRMMRGGWCGLTFRPFDAPSAPGCFADRLARLQTLRLPSHCQLVAHALCDGIAALQAAAVSAYEAGGEGYVARDPSTPYAVGRTRTILRIVPYPLSLHRRPAIPARA